MSFKADTLTEKGGFFSFRTLISTILVKIIYVLGMIGLTIFSIVMIIQTIQVHHRYGYRNGYELGIWIAVIVFGNVLWRLVCEGWILLFSIHDILGSIEKELKQK